MNSVGQNDPIHFANSNFHDRQNGQFLSRLSLYEFVMIAYLQFGIQVADKILKYGVWPS